MVRLERKRGNLRSSRHAPRCEDSSKAEYAKLVSKLKMEEITMEPNEPHIAIQLLLGCAVIFGLLAFFLAAAAG